MDKVQPGPIYTQRDFDRATAEGITVMQARRLNRFDDEKHSRRGYTFRHLL